MTQTKTETELFGWKIKSWLAQAQFAATPDQAQLVFCGAQESTEKVLDSLRSRFFDWQLKTVNFEESEIFVLAGQNGPSLIIKARALTAGQQRDYGFLAPSPYASARDLMGRALNELRRFKIESLRLSFQNCSDEEIKGCLVGLEIASYTYKTALLGSVLPQLYLEVDKTLWQEAQALGVSVNVARHLVNTPPNILYPESFAQQTAALFKDNAQVEVSIWDEERLKKENMGLHLAVGRGSSHRPHLLHMRFRPKSPRTPTPIALVGKGITFDSGGLNMKDPNGMRLMKKDMGGAAAVVGAFYWLVHSDCNRPVDIYIPMAENAISGDSYRPSDIITSKAGISVEIHNTDAEGRLVLADSIALATLQKDQDRYSAIIVTATLTGAIKVGLGSEIAGFFTNDEELGRTIAKKSQSYGDLMWQMPLFEGYRPRLETAVADINHCSTGAYGGAMTAALFLAEFAKGFPFAHMDIYAWTDAEKGALREAGGSGQAVQCLAGLLQSYRL